MSTYPLQLQQQQKQPIAGSHVMHLGAVTRATAGSPENEHHAGVVHAEKAERRQSLRWVHAAFLQVRGPCRQRLAS